MGKNKQARGDDRLQRVAEALADHRTVDWDRERAGAGDVDAQAGLDRLADIARLADAYQADWHNVARAAQERAATATGTTPSPPVAAGTSAAAPDADEPAEDAPPGQMPAPSPAWHWGRLVVHERIGTGGFGEVYRAYDPNLKRDVALKLRRAGDSAGLEKSLDEARNQARVRHPNIVTVFDCAVHDGRAGIWTDLIRGETLQHCVETRGPLSAREAAAIGIDLCGALAELHRTNLVHGDIKPANVMREKGGRIVLTDFGSALDLESDADAGARPVTALSVAPEVLRGGRPTAAADIYALGGLLFWLVTGSYPIDTDDIDELMTRQARGERASLAEKRTDVLPEFTRAVERALASDPAQRFGSAGQMQSALLASLDLVPVPDSPPSTPWWHAFTRHPWRVALGVAAAGAAAAALVLLPARLPAHAEARLFRDRSGKGQQLADGDTVQAFDQLFLELKMAQPLRVWVLDEDNEGRAYVLHPTQPGAAPRLPGKQALRLPTGLQGEEANWSVARDGAAETILVVAARQPIEALETTLAALPRVNSEGANDFAAVGAARLTRGIDGLVSRPKPADHAGTIAGLIRDLERAPGVWTWRIHLVKREP